MPYLQILQKYAYQGIFACRIHICDENSSKSYDFREKCKKNRKMISFGNFCSFFEVFTETLEQNIRKSHKNNVFQMEKKTNKEKLAIFKFLRKSALIKLDVIMSYLHIL